MQTLSINIPEDVTVLCELFNMTPQELLEQFMRDLCSLNLNGGRDERDMAKSYFLRTYPANKSVFLNDHAPDILQDFEAIYQTAYPCVGNPNWKQERQQLLRELRQGWMTKRNQKCQVV